VTELRDQTRVVARADLADVGEIGAGGEDVLLARDAHGLDLTGRRPCLEPVERLAELRQRGGSEGVGTGVIATIVERDEGEDLAGGEADIAHGRLRDDLALGERLDGGEVDVVVVRHVRAHFFFLPS